MLTIALPATGQTSTTHCSLKLSACSSAAGSRAAFPEEDPALEARSLEEVRSPEADQQVASPVAQIRPVAARCSRVRSLAVHRNLLGMEAVGREHQREEVAEECWKPGAAAEEACSDS